MYLSIRYYANCSQTPITYKGWGHLLMVTHIRWLVIPMMTFLLFVPSGQPFLSNHYPFPRGWQFNRGFSCSSISSHGGHVHVLHQTFRSQNTRQRGTETVPFYIDFLEDRFDIIVLASSTHISIYPYRSKFAWAKLQNTRHNHLHLTE